MLDDEDVYIMAKKSNVHFEVMSTDDCKVTKVVYMHACMLSCVCVRACVRACVCGSKTYYFARYSNIDNSSLSHMVYT